MTPETRLPISGATGLFERQEYRLIRIAAMFTLALATVAVVAASRDPSMFPVSVNNTIGYISPKGKAAINPQFDRGGDFEHGLASVWLEVCQPVRQECRDAGRVSPDSK
jgi:hypothetical protein